MSKLKLTPRQEAHIVSLARAGEHTTLQLAELFNVGRSTVERLGGTVLSTEDSEWTVAAVVRDPQGADFTVSQLPPS